MWMIVFCDCRLLGNRYPLSSPCTDCDIKMCTILGIPLNVQLLNCELIRQAGKEVIATRIDTQPFLFIRRDDHNLTLWTSVFDWWVMTHVLTFCSEPSFSWFFICPPKISISPSLTSLRWTSFLCHLARQCVQCVMCVYHKMNASWHTCDGCDCTATFKLSALPSLSWVLCQKIIFPLYSIYME